MSEPPPQPPPEETADPPTSNPSSSSSKFNKMPGALRRKTEPESGTESEIETEATPGDSIADPVELWEWMERYASFQFAAQRVVNASKSSGSFQKFPEVLGIPFVCM